MIVLDFLFYIVFRAFRLIPRKEKIDHLLASSFLSILLTTNVICLLFISKLLQLLKVRYQITKIYWVIFLIYGCWYFFNKWYFIKSNRQENIILSFDNKYYNSFRIMGFLGFIYIFLTFFGFWSLAYFLK